MKKNKPIPGTAKKPGTHRPYNIIEMDFIESCQTNINRCDLANSRRSHRSNRSVPTETELALKVLFISVALVIVMIAVSKCTMERLIENAKQENVKLAASTISFEMQKYPVAPVMPVNTPTTEPTQIILVEYTITAYCACIKCCGKTDGITATGVKVVEGVTVAADWSILKPGTIVEIEGIGRRTVQDKGSGVKGNHIDIYMTTHSEALKFGRQMRMVSVIGGK